MEHKELYVYIIEFLLAEGNKFSPYINKLIEEFINRNNDVADELLHILKTY